MWVEVPVYHMMRILQILLQNLRAGANYSLTQKTYLQATYGFNYVDSGIENITEDFTAHSFDAKLVINF